MCKKCGEQSCCCVKTVSKTGPRGPKGDKGPKGDTGTSGAAGPIIVQNTVFVSKNGSDSTGLAERFDKPFLTLAAARAAAVALTPSITNRILVKVEKGRYLEPIDLANFVDWDLDSSIIDGGEIGRATIDDYSTLSGGVNSIIYGFADIRKSAFASGASKSAVLIRRAESNITIYCNKIGSSVGGGLEMTNGTLFVKCKELYSTVAAPDAFAIGLGSTANANVYADEIYANGTCISNGGSGYVEVTAREIRTLTGSASTVNGGNIKVRNAKIINLVADINVVFVTNANVTLKDCVIVGAGTGYSVAAGSATNFRVYGTCYTNKATNNVTAIVSSVTVDTDVI